MEISKRNRLKAKVKSIIPANDNIEIVVELTNGLEIISITSKDIVDKLGLIPGKDICAVITASNVWIEKNES